MNQIKDFINFLEIFCKSFSKIFNILWDFLLHLKDHGIFILMADEKRNRGVHPPQKIMKKIKKIKNWKIFLSSAGFFLFSEFFCWLALQFLFSDWLDFVFHNKNPLNLSWSKWYCCLCTKM